METPQMRSNGQIAERRQQKSQDAILASL